MVKLKNIKYGLDIIEPKIIICRQTVEPGRRRIDHIEIKSISDSFNNGIDPDSEIFFSIDDNQAIAKIVNIVDSQPADSDRAAEFELAVSLLDDSRTYFYETHPVNQPARRLAVAYNRSIIDSRVDLITEKWHRPAGFKLRSLALANGYREFCHHRGGQLIALVDIHDTGAAWCLLTNLLPIATGGMIRNPGEKFDRTFLLDLMATIKYRLSTAAAGGRALPLSQIILTGAMASDGRAGEIETIAGVKTVLPELRKEFFSETAVIEGNKFLVSLGLTVDN